jgi:hypothetical protein
MSQENPIPNYNPPSSTLQNIVDPNFQSVAAAAATDSSVNVNSDNLAEAEKRKYALNDGKRGEAYRKHIHWIVIGGMYALGFVMISLMVVFALHLVLPEDRRWLNEKDCHNVERILFSGVIVSLASKYFKRYNVIDNDTK